MRLAIYGHKGLFRRALKGTTYGKNDYVKELMDWIRNVARRG